MSLVIEPKYFNKFTKEIEKKWKAISITKEKRAEGEFYFAYIIRYYGHDETQGDYDVGEQIDEFAWLGRSHTAVGKRVFSKNPETPGKRVYEEPEWEEVENQVTKEKRKVLVKGRKIWNYTIAANAENTENMKKLIGQIGLNQITTFQVIQGNTTPISVNESVFFDKTVEEILNEHNKKLFEIKPKK